MCKKEQKEYLRTVGEIIEGEYKFSIPSNQRGYRWSKQQVEELLDDIFEFYTANPTRQTLALKPEPAETDKEYYCLQPLIVEDKKNKDGEHEYFSVVDGQQRLTTIFIFLAYFDKRFTEKKKFTIKYESRKESADFLSKIEIGKKPYVADIELVDTHYMSKALDFMKSWVAEKKESTNRKYLADFLSTVMRRAVKFIWYPLEENSGENAHDVFENINANKIPLTDAELIKALLLKSSNYKIPDPDIAEKEKLKLAEMEKLKLATAWDEIERFFGNDDFWGFINNDKNPPQTRIDLLFNFYVEANIDKIGESKHYGEHILFNKFRDLFEAAKKNVEIWDDISTVYEKIREWYEDDVLYHNIGFLIASGTPQIDIFKEIEKKNKDKALARIKFMIKNKLKGYKINKPDGLDEIRYENDKNNHIKWLLVLHNIGTIVKSASGGVDNRFSFKKFKDDEWEREHIHASADGARNKDERKIWLDALIKSKIIDYLTKEADIELKDIIQSIGDEEKRKALASDDNEEKFKDIYDKFTVRFSNLEKEDKGSLKNLALLSKEINGSYQNAPFPIKRKEIIEADRIGKFIPPCTRNVFLKYYTDESEPMPLIWDDEDAKKYFADIKTVLTDYINYVEETENV